MTATRPYSPPRRVPEVMAELRRCAGSQFDPKVVEALEHIIAERSRDRMLLAA